MAAQQLTLRFGRQYELHIPVTDDLNKTQLAHALIAAGAALFPKDGNEPLSVKYARDQKLFKWAEETEVEAA